MADKRRKESQMCRSLSERERERERECVCVCVRERERVRVHARACVSMIDRSRVTERHTYLER